MPENLSPTRSSEDAPDSPSESHSEASTASSVESLPGWAQKMIGGLRKEAAGYRSELAEARSALDESKAAMADRHRRDALGGLGKLMADPDDLGKYVNLDELVDDDGAPDPGKYEEAAKSLVADKPHLGPRRPSRSSGEMTGPVRRAPDPEEEARAGTDAFVGLVQGGG